MGLFDRVKDVTGKAAEMANTISQTAKEEYEKAKKENMQKKAENDAHKKEMTERADIRAKEIEEKINARKDHQVEGLFQSLTEKELCDYTKEFYEKMVLPGSKASLSCISMFPYIDEKKKKALRSTIPDFDISETPILYIHDSEKQEFLLTIENFYFKVKFDEDRNFWCRGKIESQNVDEFSIEISETESAFKINGITVTSIAVRNIYRQDFMALNEYYRTIREKDFNIEPKEIDRLIHQKIGDKIYQQVKKYMVYDDELVMYYASGSDSLLATDYIACTTRQIIIVDREAFGATSNVKQFYYEDITSMAILQNSNSNDLLGYIIDTALTAALKICTLVITVAGSRNKINTLYTVEAERVVAIYHQYRKEAKNPLPVTQTIVQQNEPDAIEMLKKLAELKDSGIISEEEFQEKKANLLSKI